MTAVWCDVNAGSHSELLQRGGAYSLMWQRQQDMGSSHADLLRLQSNISERQGQGENGHAHGEEDEEEAGTQSSEEEDMHGKEGRSCSQNGTPESQSQRSPPGEEERLQLQSGRQRRMDTKAAASLRRRLETGSEDEI